MRKSLIILLPGLLTVGIMLCQPVLCVQPVPAQTKIDRSEISRFIEEMKRNAESNPEKNIEIGGKLLRTISVLPPAEVVTEYKIDVRLYMGLAYLELVRNDEAQKNLEKVIKLVENSLPPIVREGEDVLPKPDAVAASDSPFKTKYARALDGLGIIAWRQSNFSLAANYHERAGVIWDLPGSGDLLQKSENLRLHGLAHKGASNYERAMTCYQESLEIKQKIEDEKGVGSLHNNIGTVHYLMEDYTKAKESYNNSLDIHEKSENKLGQTYVLTNLGNLMHKQADKAEIRSEKESLLNQAKDNYLEALKNLDIIRSKPVMVVIINNLGEVYMKLGRHEKSYTHFNRALKVAEAKKDDYNAALVANNMSQLLLKTGETVRALRYANRAHQLAREAESNEMILKCLERLIQVYEKLELYQDANEFHKQLREVSDEYLRSNFSKEMAGKLQTYENMINENKYKETSAELQRKKTQALYYQVVGLLVLIIAVINFILYRYKKKAEATIRESEEKYRQLVERANDGIAVVQNGIFRYANPRLIDLLGFSSAEITGLQFQEVVAPEKREQWVNAISRGTTGAAETYETVLLHKDGTRIDVDINTGIVPFGNRPADILFIRDIRGQKQLEEERLKRSKLESIGMLAGGIAHDYNNILGVILGNIELARMGLAEDSSQYLSLDKAERATMKARDLAQQFLTFSEGGAPVKRHMALPPLVDAAAANAEKIPDLADIRGQYPRSPQIHVEMPGDLWKVECDAGQVQLAITNLIVNALEATYAKHPPEPGTPLPAIRIVAENTLITPQQVGYLQAGKYIRLVIEDQGDGIKKEHVPKIFDPYFSTRNRLSQKGLGLGLTIAYSIVKRHDGHIEINSTPGAGTGVSVYFPTSRKHLSHGME